MKEFTNEQLMRTGPSDPAQEPLDEFVARLRGMFESGASDSDIIDILEKRSRVEPAPQLVATCALGNDCDCGEPHICCDHYIEPDEAKWSQPKLLGI